MASQRSLLHGTSRREQRVRVWQQERDNVCIWLSGGDGSKGGDFNLYVDLSQCSDGGSQPAKHDCPKLAYHTLITTQT